MSRIGIGYNFTQPNTQCMSCKYWVTASKVSVTGMFSPGYCNPGYCKKHKKHKTLKTHKARK